MTKILENIVHADFDKSAVAVYRSHPDAEAAVRTLARRGVRITRISIIGRNFETHEDIQGFYRPSDAACSGAGTGAWVGGFFGLMWGAMGMFVIPFVGPLFVLGPLAGMIAGAVGGAGVGALISGLIASGVPKEQALIYQRRLKEGDFLVVVHGTADEIEQAHDILQSTDHAQLQAYSKADEIFF